MFNLSEVSLLDQHLESIAKSRSLINTINAHSYNLAQKDIGFRDALIKSDYLLPDGISIVWAMRWLTGKKLHKIAGADLFRYEMERLQNSVETSHALSVQKGKVFFLGSTETTLAKIKARAVIEYPNIEIATYSPPFKLEFSPEENATMIGQINAFQPDVLFIGMTAPKQEKWAYTNFDKLPDCHVCCIGAVFDFYAGTIKRVPHWMLKLGLEWLYRLMKEPRRMWRRYLIGNPKFIVSIIREKFSIRNAPVV